MSRLHFLPDGWLWRLMRLAMTALGARQRRLYTFHARPLDAACLQAWPDPNPATSRIAVILQGPVIRDSDFTVETLLWYATSFPGSPIVLSTWADEDLADVRRRAPGVHIVTSPKPAASGIMNVNFQVRSTRAGLEAARELGADFALKTRTDVRLYSHRSGALLLSLLRAFPATHAGQRHRIVSTSFTPKFLPYHIADHVMFGSMDDMLAFWSLPEDDRAADRPPGDTRAARMRARASPELLLTLHYLEHLGIAPEWTIAHGWKCCAECFCVIDNAMLDLVWFKYNYAYEHRERLERPAYESRRNDEPLTFGDWLELYVGGGTAPRASVLDAGDGATIVPADFGPIGRRE